MLDKFERYPLTFGPTHFDHATDPVRGTMPYVVQDWVLTTTRSVVTATVEGPLSFSRAVQR